MSSSEQSQYTCNDYRQEMTLLGLRRALEQTEPGSEERKRLEEEIERLEKLMDM